MSALQSLFRANERMIMRNEVPAFGFSTQKIGFLIPLNPDGSVAGKPISRWQGEGKKRVAAGMAVPQPPKRTSGIAPGFLWDKTSYVLGVTAGEGKRLAREHADFIDKHREWLAGTDDEGLRAFLAFLDWWKPERFAELEWPEEMKDENVVFSLESERQQDIRIHDRPAARDLWARLSAEGPRREAICLITGERRPIARLHPAIKGVWGAQTAGASIVSFNLDAFTSYGQEQGDNAPTSVAAAAGYTSALNYFLERDSGHRLQIGDASTVFWADSSDAVAAQAAESFFSVMLDDKKADAVEERKIEAILGDMQKGQKTDFRADLYPGVRFFILGLSPNAARLSLRFYLEDEFGVLAGRYLEHLQRLRVEPWPEKIKLSMWRMLVETAVLGKTENIQPNLAGEWLRAILTGAPYPGTLLACVIMRLRADHNVNAVRVAILKSILIRNFNMEVPVALDPTYAEQGYLLGRLFAVYEQIQRAALGDNVNATIKDKYYGAASAQPRKVFHLLDSGSANHLSKIGKQNKGRQVNLEKDVSAIMAMMTPSEDPFPASLPDRSQALFGLGYYHQRFHKPEKPAAEDASQ